MSMPVGECINIGSLGPFALSSSIIWLWGKSLLQSISIGEEILNHLPAKDVCDNNLYCVSHFYLSVRSITIVREFEWRLFSV